MSHIFLNFICRELFLKDAENVDDEYVEQEADDAEAAHHQLTDWNTMEGFYPVIFGLQIRHLPLVFTS